MTKIDEAMMKHIDYIVFSEHRPFSYMDFLRFRVDEEEFGMTHGTFRNKIWKLKTDGKVQLDYLSSCAFYTKKEHRFGKPMTPNHTGVHNHPLYKFLKNLVLDKQSIHNIRLRVSIPGMWTMLSKNPNFHRNKRSEDIVIPSWRNGNAILGITVHKTDTVSVTIASSFQPIPLDFIGINRFFTLLGGIEEKL